MVSTGSASGRVSGPRVRTAVALGVGLTLGIWILVGYFFSRRVADLDVRAAAVSARYLRAQEHLMTARSQILVASVSVRDALLDSAQPAARDYRRELDTAYEAAEAALAAYEPVLNPAVERDRIEHLRRQVTELRVATAHVLDAEGPRLPTESGRILRSQIMPKREAVIEVTDDLQSLNRAVFLEHLSEVAGLYRSTQRQLWQALGVALAASLAIGVFVAVYARRLEDRISRQRAKEIQNRMDLQRLSASLVVAQEEERRAIARELHDEVGQVLTAIKVELTVAQRAIESAGGPASALEDVRAIADRAMHTVRDLSQLLHPPLLEDLGLPAAVEWYVKGFRKRHDIRVDLQHGPPVGPLPRETAVAAYRIVQEALNNVAKHAHATECRVQLGQGLDALVVTVEDNGVGFDVGALERGERPKGIGLLGIRERIDQLDGRLRLTSIQHQGTRLTVELPTADLAANNSGERQSVAIAGR
jgi:signal transduction histidine kinase